MLSNTNYINLIDGLIENNVRQTFETERERIDREWNA